jgi:hypothetical protein
VATALAVEEEGVEDDADVAADAGVDGPEPGEPAGLPTLGNGKLPIGYPPLQPLMPPVSVSVSVSVSSPIPFIFRRLDGLAVRLKTRTCSISPGEEGKWTFLTVGVCGSLPGAKTSGPGVDGADWARRWTDMFGVDWDREGRWEDLSEDFRGFPFARRKGDEDVLIGVGRTGATTGEEDLTGELTGLPVLGNGTDRCGPCRDGGMVSCSELPGLIFSGGTPRFCTSSSSSSSGDELSSSS